MRVEAPVQRVGVNRLTVVRELCRVMGYGEDERGFFRIVDGEVYRPIYVVDGKFVYESSLTVALRQRVV